MKNLATWYLYDKGVSIAPGLNVKMDKDLPFVVNALGFFTILLGSVTGVLGFALDIMGAL